MSLGSLSGQSLSQGLYVLDSLLGIGGMGAVYHAQDTRLKRDVAVKVILPNLEDAQFVHRFEREARLVAALDHPNIVKIYTYGTENNLNYIVMQYLSGGTLKQRLEAGARKDLLPSLGETSLLIGQIAGALQHAHDQGIIHRDVKPGNVMFDAHGNALLVDFGIARPDGQAQQTVSTFAAYTKNYAAPEQIAREPLTAAVDQYALAIITFQMVTGRLPFVSDIEEVVAVSHLRDIPPLAHEVRSGVPARVSAVLAKALEKQPKRRYESILAFADALDDATAGAEGQRTAFFSLPLRQSGASARTPSGSPRSRPRTGGSASQRNISTAGQKGGNRGRWLAIGGVLIALALVIAVLVGVFATGSGASVAQLATATQGILIEMDSPTPSHTLLPPTDTLTPVPPTAALPDTETPVALLIELDNPTPAHIPVLPTGTSTIVPPTAAPSATETPEATLIIELDTATPTVTRTATNTRVPATSTPRPTQTPRPTGKPTGKPTGTPTPTASATRTPRPTHTPTETPIPLAANFSVSVTSGEAPLMVRFENTSTGEYDSVVWDFGDGSGSAFTAGNMIHVFRDPGTYRVTLTVTEPGGSDSVSREIEVIEAVDAPVASFTSSASSGSAPLTVQFENTSTGDSQSALWGFGDGRSSRTNATNVSHVFRDPGTYHVTLTVTGPGGSDSVSHEIEVIEAVDAPVASFTASVSSGNAPLTVQFQIVLTGEYDSVVWDFGDGSGSASVAENMIHVFRDPGTYNVTLTIGRGTEQSIARQTIVVSDPVIAEINADSANIRRGPGTEYAVVDTAARGEVFTITGRNAQADWIQIRQDNGGSGWIALSIVTTSGQIQNVEVAAPSATATSSSSGSSRGPWDETHSVNVQANVGWPSTQIQISSGDRVRISASPSDTWSWTGGAELNAEGLTGYIAGYFGIDAPFAALLGQVGSGNRFIVGTDYTFTSQDNGNLALTINDIGLEDNSGSISVTVDIDHP